MRKLTIGLLLLVVTSFAHADQVVNVYNWTGYMSDDVLAQFTKETGIKVNYSTFASNDELFAKIAASNNHSGYDVIVPSAGYVARMARLGMLQKLDRSQLTYFKNIDPDFLDKPFDRGNQYSVPYLWGTTGLVVNRSIYPDLKLRHWTSLWDPALKDQVLMIDEDRTAFDIALKVLGYSANTQDPEQIKQAYEKLRELLPNIKLFNIVAPQSIYINGDAAVGVGYNGDTYIAMQTNPNLQYIYPEEGVFVWIDCMTIPQNAPNRANAYKFINFMLRADIAAKIAESVGYSSANAAGVKLLPRDMQRNPTLYPDRAIIKKSEFENDVGDAAEIYEHYWQLLKLGG
jgi:spermidine/putrescine transport system substrate-binding protein